jgi:hypothetical protein
MKTMPTQMYRLLTGQETPIYIWKSLSPHIWLEEFIVMFVKGVEFFFFVLEQRTVWTVFNLSSSLFCI